MFDLDPDATDDPGFIALVGRIITGAVLTHQPDDALVFKIDNWLDHKWLGSSGKTLGSVGVWARPLTIPPFVANRIVRQWRCRREEETGGYIPAGAGPDIHHRGWSARNLRRRVRRVVPSSAPFWFSGSTSATGHGSLMAYIPVEQDHWPWSLAFTRTSGWQVAHRKDIHSYEVRLFREAAAKRQGDRLASVLRPVEPSDSSCPLPRYFGS